MALFFGRRSLFRTQAFARRGQTEPLDGLLRVTAPHEWVALAGIGLAVLGFVAWSVFGSVERSVSAECLLVHPGERYAVLSEVTGYVAAVLVPAGDVVEAAEPIARVRTTELERQVGVARARVELLQAQGQAGKPDDDALALAHAELLDLEAMQTAGEYIVSPYAGTVTWHSLTVGQGLTVGTEVAGLHDGVDGELQAVASFPAESARRIAPGMEAGVLAGGLSHGRALEAEVIEVPGPPATQPSWLTALGFDSPVHSHIVWVTLREAPEALPSDGTQCRLRIIMGRERPVRLLGPF